MKPLVIYHGGCWDGFCAAWVAKTALGPIEAVPAQYGLPPPPVLDREVYILDFSYPRETLIRMAQQTSQLLVLDHHATAAAALDGLPFCRFAQDKSGGRMSWEYFADLGGWLGMPAPWLVDYTEDRDLWRHALPNSQEVNAALRSYPLDFDLWDRQFAGAGPPPIGLIQEGAAIRRRERQIIDEHLQHARLENFDGTHTVPVVNATVLFSEIAGELAEGHPFAACYFDRPDGKRQWSLRSTSTGVDVAEIAKAHGGGGHRHAAGFEEVMTA
jgi:oligoribonuclease NrnB/cAMP/cGMP phosphodiesterase (DHH superfamily)